MSEHNIQRDAQIELSARGVPMWRNNVAKAWVGKLIKPSRPGTVYIGPGDIVLQAARPLDAGLAKGSGDLIGIKTITITPEMVGTQIGVFCSGEAKDKHGVISREQGDWDKMVRARGGISGFFRSADEAIRIFCS